MKHLGFWFSCDMKSSGCFLVFTCNGNAFLGCVRSTVDRYLGWLLIS